MATLWMYIHNAESGIHNVHNTIHKVAHPKKEKVQNIVSNIVVAPHTIYHILIIGVFLLFTQL